MKIDTTDNHDLFEPTKVTVRNPGKEQVVIQQNQFSITINNILQVDSERFALQDRHATVIPPLRINDDNLLEQDEAKLLTVNADEPKRLPRPEQSQSLLPAAPKRPSDDAIRDGQQGLSEMNETGLALLGELPSIEEVVREAAADTRPATDHAGATRRLSGNKCHALEQYRKCNKH